MSETIQFGITETIHRSTQRPLQAGSGALLEKVQLSPEVSAHQLSATLPAQHPDGHRFLDALSAPDDESSLNSV